MRVHCRIDRSDNGELHNCSLTLSVPCVDRAARAASKKFILIGATLPSHCQSNVLSITFPGPSFSINALTDHFRYAYIYKVT